MPSSSTVTAPSNTVEASSSASIAQAEKSAPSAKKQKVQKVLRPGQQSHRPETKAKIDLFHKIRSSEKNATDVKRSAKELELWEIFKSAKRF